MWRAFFLAVGVTLIIMGIELFFVDQVEVVRIRGMQDDPNSIQSVFRVEPAPYQNASSASTVMHHPKPWMAWGFLAVGAVVVIYTFTIPKRRLE